MNIFEIYFDKIIKTIKAEKKNRITILAENLNSINVDIPPEKFDCDISTNVAMILAKSNKRFP